MPTPAEISSIVDQHLESFRERLEASLATSMQKALDTVVSEFDERLRGVEEDLARLLRHSGLK